MQSSPVRRLDNERVNAPGGVTIDAVADSVGCAVALTDDDAFGADRRAGGV
jgi:hypothetical protein